MDVSKWNVLAGRLSRILDNEVRVFRDDEIRALRRICNDDDPRYAARVLARQIARFPVGGELRHELALRFGEVIDEPIPMPTHGPVVEKSDISQWATNPRATTMDRRPSNIT